MPKQKKMDIPRIKGVVMFFVSLGIGVLSAVTGIGGQAAMAPSIQFLLGFVPERTAGLGMFFALCASIGAVIGVSAVGIKISGLHVVVLMVGATLGALPGQIVAKKLPSLNPARIAHTALSLVYAWLITEALKHAGPLPFGSPIMSEGALSILLIGIMCGLVSGSLHISVGALMVPALLYFAGLPPAVAISTTVAVGLAATLLPVAGYQSRGLIDSSMSRWVGVGGASGGVLGGALLSPLFRLSISVPMVVFSLYAMFLSGWMIQQSLIRPVEPKV